MPHDLVPVPVLPRCQLFVQQSPTLTATAPRLDSKEMELLSPLTTELKKFNNKPCAWRNVKYVALNVICGGIMKHIKNAKAGILPSAGSKCTESRLFADRQRMWINRQKKWSRLLDMKNLDANWQTKIRQPFFLLLICHRHIQHWGNVVNKLPFPISLLFQSINQFWMISWVK